VNVSVTAEPGLVLKCADPPRYPRNAASAQLPEYVTVRSESSTDRSRKAVVTDEPDRFNRYTESWPVGADRRIRSRGLVATLRIVPRSRPSSTVAPLLTLEPSAAVQPIQTAAESFAAADSPARLNVRTPAGAVGAGVGATVGAGVGAGWRGGWASAGRKRKSTLATPAGVEVRAAGAEAAAPEWAG
jgi:hypothetical protein